MNSQCPSRTENPEVLPSDSVFERLLAKYFAGGRDAKTLKLLGLEPESLQLGE